jgi:hypothetical protein
MSCKLNKFQTYDVGQVRYDRGTGSYSVQIINPGPLCPNGEFNSKKAKLIVNAGSSPSLGFSLTDNKPVITVPNEGFVINYGNGFGFGDALLVIGGVIIAFFVGRYIYRKLSENSADENYATTATNGYAGSSNYSSTRYIGSRAYPSQPSTPQASPSSGGGTTVVNNNSGPDLLTTVLLANALSSHDHGGGGNSDSHNTTINNYSSDDRDDDSSSSSSSSDTFSSDSDSDSSYSSDSDSSSDYSSDSSSSSDYSSDSSSSDSGSSFSSD